MIKEAVEQKLFLFIKGQVELTERHLKVARQTYGPASSEIAMHKFISVLEKCHEWLQENNESRVIKDQPIDHNHDLTAVDCLKWPNEGDMVCRFTHLEVPAVFNDYIETYEVPWADKTMLQKLAHACRNASASRASVSRDVAYTAMNAKLFDLSIKYVENRGARYWEEVFRIITECRQSRALDNTPSDPGSKTFLDNLHTNTLTFMSMDKGSFDKPDMLALHSTHQAKQCNCFKQ